jgi:hypothetical protein
MELRNVTINGMRIAYHDQTRFLVQIGRYSKGSYRTRYSVTGDLHQAVRYYNALNIGNGYKKRLYMEHANQPVLAVQSSY